MPTFNGWLSLRNAHFVDQRVGMAYGQSVFSVDTRNRPAYYRYQARLAYEAALAADNVVGHWPGYAIAAPPPVMTMCAHAIELSLKAYLLDNGIDERTVRKFGHDLVGCWGKCIEVGANPDLLDMNILAITSDLLVSGRLRYGEESDLGRVPVFGPLSTLVEASLALCGAPKVSDILS